MTLYPLAALALIALLLVATLSACMAPQESSKQTGGDGEGSTGITTTPSQCSGMVDVTTQGIVPNDEADDYQPLTNLINSSPSGTMLCFPSGVYDIGESWVAIMNKDIKFVGAEGATIRKLPGSNLKYLLSFYRTPGGGVDNITFDGYSSDQPTVSDNQLILVGSGDNMSFTNNDFKDIPGDGIVLTYAYDEPNSPTKKCTTNTTIDANTFTNHNEGREAVFHVCGDSNRITNNKIYEWGLSRESGLSPGGIDIESDWAEDYHTNLVVENNYIRNNSSVRMWSGIHMAITYYGSHVEGVVIRGNEITGNYQDAISPSAVAPDSVLLETNNIYDITNAHGAFYNDGPNHYKGNIIRNVNGGTGECILQWYLSPPYVDDGGNDFQGCIYSTLQ